MKTLTTQILKQGTYGYRSLVRTLSLALAVTLTACGGGGGGSDLASSVSSVAETATGSTAAMISATEQRARSTRSTTQKLTVSRTGKGVASSSPLGISCGSACSASYTTGTSVTLTATPTTGYQFSGWGGACAGTSTTCAVSMASAASVSATFTAIQTTTSYTLSVTDGGTGTGTVTSSTGGISCAAGTCSASIATGTSVTLTATPASGNTFTGWSGACSGTATTCTVTMSADQSATASFALATTSTGSGTTTGTTTSCAQGTSSTTLANIITNSSGSYTANTVLNSACPADTAWGSVNGKCYGSYAVQSNAYQTPPASTSFSMWSNSASCWGINVSEPSNANSIFWNAPLVTRGFSFGFNGLLTSAGGVQVSTLNTQYASSATPCPATGTASGVCAKWSMNVPGVSAQSAANTSSATYGKWNALMDIYFHDTATPAVQKDTVFDLQIYQMVMDFNVGSVPNWATYILGTYTTKTIGGITYLVSVNMGDPGTEGSSWVGNGGTNNSISMFPLPTYATTKAAGGTGGYLWGTASATHDIGGIISWLSQPKTVNGVTGIFDDAGNLLYDNVRRTKVTSALLKTTSYLTGFNPSFEVVSTTPSTTYPNNTVFTTTNFWVAMPGETVGN